MVAVQRMPTGFLYREVRMYSSDCRQATGTEVVCADTCFARYAVVNAGGTGCFRKLQWGVPCSDIRSFRCFYTVNVVLLTANDLSVSGSRAKRLSTIRAMMCSALHRADTICFHSSLPGVERPGGRTQAYGEKKEGRKCVCPTREPFNQAVMDYRFQIPETGYETRRLLPPHLTQSWNWNGSMEKIRSVSPFPILCSWNFPGMCIKASTACCRKVQERDGTQIRRDQSLFHLLRKYFISWG